MACVRKRRGKFMVDWRDHTGRRRWRTFKTRRDAERFLGTVINVARDRSSIPSNVTLEGFVHYPEGGWLSILRTKGTKAQSIERYLITLKTHVLPELGHVKVADLTQSRLVAFLTGAGSPRACYQVLFSILARARFSNLIAANPLAGVGKELKLTSKRKKDSAKGKALDADQLRVFLETVRTKYPELYPLFLTMASTGIRWGEAQALEWTAIDWQGGKLEITRNQVRDGSVGPPKSPEGHRSVDVAADVLSVLRPHRAAQGVPQPRRVFFPELDEPTAAKVHACNHRIAYQFARVLKTAGLPGRFTVHGLRHTWASLHVAAGTSLAWIQQQLGHSSIELTISTYGSWLKAQAPGAVDLIARTVAKR